MLVNESFLCVHREANGQVGRIGCYSSSHQCGDQGRGEGGALPRTIHMPS